VKVVELAPDQLLVSDELSRSGSAKQFEDRLRSSIEEIGLAEPIKVALTPFGQYLVVDGTMRLRAIEAIRKADPSAFTTVSAYVTDYDRRYEIRYQTDIYQDLLPSQLATLVEHLHKTERVLKVDIARYIGVSPATLRNYTGLWRLMQRGGVAAKIAELMDVGVIPASNPYAWLRLTDEGLRLVLEENLTEGVSVEEWINEQVLTARHGHVVRYITAYVEAITGSLPDRYYLADEEVRNVKRDLGLRRGAGQGELMPMVAVTVKRDVTKAVRHLNRVSRETTNPVLKTAAKSFKAYLK
jgi:ParB-like chromosome segregation protein Spo0J